MICSKPKITIHPSEPECVRWVADRVMEDFESVPADTLANIPDTIIAGANDALVQEVLARHPDLPEFEGFAIDRVDAESPRLVVAARHFRGTMFGLLDISRRLGVDPFRYFTDMDQGIGCRRGESNPHPLARTWS